MVDQIRQHRHPIDLGHGEVGNDNFIRPLLHELQRLFATGTSIDFIPLGSQQLREVFPNRAGVIDH
jgi:hypothetical protein